MSDTAPAPAAPAPTPAPAAAPAPAGSEEQELLALHQNDPQTFEYAPYKDTGRTGAERLYDLRQAQQAASGDDTADEAADDGIEVDDIDLDAPADDAEGEEGEAGEDDGEALDLSAYQDLPEGMELSKTGEAVIGIVNEFCEEQGYGPEGRNGLLDLHNRLIEAQTARLSELDKAASNERAAALTERLGSKEAYDAYAATAREAAKLMPKPLRDALKAARLPDGRKVAHMPELIDFLHQVAGRQGRASPQPQDSVTAMQQELRDLDQLMNTDIDTYHRQWRGTGRSGSERRLEIMRELTSEGPAKPSAADVRSEIRELEALRSRDIQMFQFGSWRGSGRPAAERLAALQAGRG